MEFYKKNPKIKENITVQGVLFDDVKVVSGEEFKIFADPKTFPGIPVKLVVVNFDKLTKDQQDQAREFAIKQGQKPPKHLGVIKSDDFMVTESGDIKVEKKIASPKEAVPPKKTVSQIQIPPKKKDREIKEIYSAQEFVDLMPGVTGANVKKVLKRTTTLKALSVMSNADLRKMGVSLSFAGRLREKAAKLAKKEK